MPHSTEDAIEQLNHQLMQIVYWFKQQQGSRWTRLFSNKHVYDKSWTLLVGMPQAGKTSLLQQADLNVIQGQVEDHAESCTWFNNEGVFIELPTLSKTPSEEEIAYLQYFIQTIKKHRKRRPFDNVVVTINTYHVIHEYAHYAEYLTVLKEQLEKALGPYLTARVGVYIVFTHMDKIAGFCDFFGAFSSYHQTHTLGYVFDEYNDKKQLLAQHEKKYDRLLGRLHENLVTLLHKTRNPLTRYLIREFPQQLDSLRNIVRSSIALFGDKLLEGGLKGVFFTSARQGGVSVDRMTVNISASYQLTLPSHFPQASRAQPYFVKGLFQLMSKKHYQEDTRFAKYRREHKTMAYGLYALAALLFLGLGFYYHYTADRLNTATTALQQYQQSMKNNTLAALIPDMNYLMTARNTLNDVNTWLIPFRNLNDTKQWVNTEYQRELSQQFLPQVAHKMEEYLLTNPDPATQYETLKAYLMLGNPAYVNIDYLKDWLHRYLKLSSEANLKTALLKPFPGIALNQSLINQVRNTLNLLPLDYLMYAVIKQQSQNIYTREIFEKQYTQTIPAQTRHMLHERWVLNNTAPIADNLNHQIRQRYIVGYIYWWRLVIDHSQPKSFNTAQEAAVYFQQWVDKSQLTNMWANMQKNTQAFAHPNSVQAIFNEQIATKLSLPDAMNTLEQAKPYWRALAQYFSLMEKSTDPGLMAFQTLRQKFEHPEEGTLHVLLQLAKTAPPPVNSWIRQVVLNSWFVILSEAKTHMNQQWQAQVMIPYQHTIAQRFPINSSAEKDITLEDFSHFFNAQGVLAQFFEQYVKPFLNMQQAQWTLKSIDGLTVPVRTNVITEFERANVIREMFFPQGALIPSVKFVIQSSNLQPIVRQAILNINGQILASSQVQKNVQHVTWPGNYNDAPVTLSITAITGEQLNTAEYGPWGLFKLLAHANIQPMANDPRDIQVLLDLNGNMVEYLLKAYNPVNPFTPYILQSFQLPPKLF